MSALLRRPVRLAAAGLAGALVAGLLAAAPSTAAAKAAWDPDAECFTPAPEAAPDDSNGAPVLAADSVSLRGGTIADLDVLANDTDPDGDDLVVLSTTEPPLGLTCVLDDGQVRYVAPATRRDRQETFSYTATDGDRLRSTDVAVLIEGVAPVKPELRVKIRTNKSGKVTRRAALRFTNPNDFRITVVAGDPDSERASFRRTMNPGGSFVWRTGLERAAYVTGRGLRSEDPYLLNAGVINTGTGRHPRQYIGMSFSVLSYMFGSFERRSGQSFFQAGLSRL